VEKERLSFRPMTEQAELFGCPVAEIHGVCIEVAHSFLGVTFGPGTSKVLNEIAFVERTSASFHCRTE
jgi:hypothetical protein